MARSLTELTSSAEGQASRGDRSFLPNFCDGGVVFIVVIIAELFAVILGLAPSRPQPDRWTHLGLTSLFVLWVTLGSVAALCALRPRLAGAGVVVTTVVATIIVLASTAVVTALTLALDHATGAGLLPTMESPLGFGLRNMGIAAIIALLALRYFYMQREWRSRHEAEASARIQALQARIRPHFLFNSMNTIASLVHSEPDKAERAVEDLSELFRASLSARGRVRLEDELELTRRYLDLERLRLGDRLQVDWEIAAGCRRAVVPSLILQPLVENAIYHGIQALPGPGTIEIRAHRNDGSLDLFVSNPLSKEALMSADTSGNHMAQANIRERLELAYGSAGRLEIDTYTGRYNVTATLPFEDSSDEGPDHR